jgi:hypothetical protein
MMQNRYTTATGGLSIIISRSLKILQPPSLRIIELNVRRKAVHGATATALAATGFPDTSNTPDKGGKRSRGIVSDNDKNYLLYSAGAITACCECRSNTKENQAHKPIST